MGDDLKVNIGINHFSIKLQNKLISDDDYDTISSLGIHAFLTLISQDPWFYSKNFLNSALCVDVNLAANRYKEVFAAINGVDGLQSANGFFMNHQGQVSEVFGNRIRDNFASEVKFLDFTKPEGALAAINAWVVERTAQKIPPFISLKDDVNFTFLNATRFKGNWAQPFSIQETVPGTFYVDERNTVEVQMMRKKGEFYFDKIARLLKLPFAGSSASLVIVLPTEGTIIDELLTRIPLYFAIVTKSMIKTEVDVCLPKFKLNNSLELSQHLKKLGLEKAFNANLSDVIDNEELTCSDVLHNAFLEINEDGAEAVAGTVLTLAKLDEVHLPPKDGLKVYEASITSEITNRFAKTKVVWKVKNTNETAADATFKVVLTETAFITEFVMEVEGKSYKSYIKEKEKAKNIFNKAVARGQSAGLVEAKTRDSREFTVSVNLEPNSVAVFSLTYEELLQRVHDQYELVLNICPGQIVDKLNIEVRIDESRPLKFVKTPPLRSGNDLNTSKYAHQLDPQSDVKVLDPKTATVTFQPDSSKQRKMAHFLGNEISNGLSGQFVVQYDIERDPLNGEVLLQDGYFVQYFAPNDLDPLPKHVIFVLDTSRSMDGRKIQQLKDAMMNILGDLQKGDMLSIIEFNTNVVVWDIDLKKSATVSFNRVWNFNEPFTDLKNCILADPSTVSDDIIRKAKEVIQDIVADGNTFMIGGLQTALYLVKTGQQKTRDKDQRLQPIIVFLTDGEPNIGIPFTPVIVDLVTQQNLKDKVPIFSLSFGDSADKNFLRKLSLKNSGFSRHIYEAADASLQLQNFYKQISSPLLREIEFKYDGGVEDVTRTWFPIYFKGSELIVAGRCQDEEFPTTINCCGPCGPIIINSTTKRAVTSLERLWAYLMVKQLLDDSELAKNSSKLTKKAVELALKYSFVTDVTSLVVVKPPERVLNSQTAKAGFNYLRKCATRIKQIFRGHPPSANSCLLQADSGRSFQSRAARSTHFQNRGMCLSLGTNIGNQLENQSRRIDRQQLRRCTAFADNLKRKEELEPNLIYAYQGIEEKHVEEITVNRPFLVFLQVEEAKTILISFQGRISRPTY